MPIASISPLFEKEKTPFILAIDTFVIHINNIFSEKNTEYMSDSRPNRIEWIDICKFIGIFTVVWGHTGTVHYVNNYIHAFHMPLFFFISGYCFNYEKYSSISYLAKNRIKTLLIPYFLFGTVLFCFWNSAAIVLDRGGDVKGLQTLLSSILWINTQATTFGVVQWFLTCLFLTEITYWLILKFTKKNINLLFVLFLVSIIAYLYPLYIEDRLPWALDVTFSAVFFYGIGWLCKIYFSPNRVSWIIGKKWCWALILAGGGVSLVTVYLNGDVNMRTLKYGNYVLFYLNAIMLISLTILVSGKFCSILGGTKIHCWMKYVGRNTIIILLLNSTFIRVFDVILGSTISNFDLCFQYVIFTVIAVSVLATLTPACFIINRYVPFIIGRKKLLVQLNR